jgi:hypothetical protein
MFSGEKRVIIRFADKYSPSTGGRGLEGGGAELLQRYRVISDQKMEP